MSAGRRTELVRVAPGRWRDACERRLAAGERFLAAHAGPGESWSAVFESPGGETVLRTEPAGGAVATIADLVPAADWDEREAADLRGLRFEGRAATPALADHEGEFRTPVRGEGVHQVAVGPIHAGVIESGHFRFHAVGERILHLDLRHFYKHRGLERLAEGAPVERGLAIAGRACGACAVANSAAFAAAAEALRGRRPTRDVARARTLLLELERLYNHLNDIGAICAGVGFAPGAMAFAAHKERAMRLNRRLGGHRFLFGTVAVGGSGLRIGAAEARRARSELAELAAEAARSWREVRFSPSVAARLDGVGTLSREDAAALGTVGPAARASGLRRDARSLGAGLWYGSEFRPARPPRESGDVEARLELRPLELEATFAILDELLAEPHEPAACRGGGERAPLGIGRVESPRGETVCALELRGGRIARLRLRTGSYANWPALARAAAGELLPDFPLINKSFELCYACSDR